MPVPEEGVRVDDAKDSSGLGETYSLLLECFNCNGIQRVDIPWGVPVGECRAVCRECGCSDWLRGPMERTMEGRILH